MAPQEYRDRWKARLVSWLPTALQMQETSHNGKNLNESYIANNTDINKNLNECNIHTMSSLASRLPACRTTCRISFG